MRGKPHPNQEVSAFVEAGVFYVKTLADMANKPNAAVSSQTDWGVIQSWLGAQGWPPTPEERDRFRVGWKAYIGPLYPSTAADEWRG